MPLLGCPYLGNWLISTKKEGTMSNIIPVDFEGHSMRFYEDGWIDATTAAEKFDKVPNEFLRLPETESYIQGLERRYGKIPYVKPVGRVKIVAVVHGCTQNWLFALRAGFLSILKSGVTNK